MTTVKEIIYAVLNEIKTVLKEYVHETEDAFKKRLKRLLITSIIGSVLMALAISMLGSAALFLLIGQLKYLSTFMPAWEAWDVMGLTSGVIGALLLFVLFIIIRNQLRTKQN